MASDLSEIGSAFEAAAARTRRRYPTREPDPLSLAASQGGVPWGTFLPSEERARASAASLQAGGDYNPRDVLLSALGAVGSPVAVGGVPLGSLGSGVGKGIRAYHGSPHDFERFDLSKIGTGEGAQAYGHGLYFAEAEPTALSYKNATRVTDMNWPVAGTDYTLPAWVARTAQNSPRALEEVRGNFVGRVAEAQRELAAGDHNAAERLYHTQRVVDALDAVKGGAELKKPGRMYEVNIHAQPEQMLPWDQPLPMEHPARAAALEAIPKARLFTSEPEATLRGTSREAIANLPDVSGQRLYSALERRLGSSPQASDVLKEAGIPGIKYLDQGSRGPQTFVARHPQGGTFEYPTEAEAKAFVARNPDYQLEAPKSSSNYVLFRDDIIDILRKYGLAGAAPAGGALMMQDPRSQ